MRAGGGGVCLRVAAASRVDASTFVSFALMVKSRFDGGGARIRILANARAPATTRRHVDFAPFASSRVYTRL